MNPFPTPRPTCYRCFRPEQLCYCTELRPIDNQTKIVIVQHPREQFHPLNTVRIVERCLRRVEVIRCRPTEVAERLERTLESKDVGILFPSPDAEDLSTMLPEERPREIIVLDGTWHHAKALLRDVPTLRRHRRVRFTPERPSEYRIRKEPRADYLSTLESIAHVLRLSEPETPNIDHLNRVFRFMIEQNVAARVEREEGLRQKKRERKIPHRFPEKLFLPRERLVAVYCEGTSRWALPAPGNDGGATSADGRVGKEPLVVYVQRSSDTVAKRWLVRTEALPPERLLTHLQVSREEIALRSQSSQAVAAEMRAFFKPGEIPVVWNASSREILRELGVLFDPLVLKGVYCDYETYLERRRRGEGSTRGLVANRVRWGGMDEVLEKHGIQLAAPTPEARGELRVRQTAAVLSWIWARTAVHCSSFQD